MNATFAMVTPFSSKGWPSIRTRRRPTSSTSTSPLPSGKSRTRDTVTSTPKGSTCPERGA